MIDHLIIEYEKLLKERIEIEKANSKSKKISLPVKIIMGLFLFLAIPVIYFLLQWIFAPQPNNYGTYLLFSLILFFASLYSGMKLSDYELASRIYDNSKKYKSDILTPLKNLLLKYDLANSKKIEVLISQIDDKIPESKNTLDLIKKFATLIFLPLSFALYGVYLTKYNSIAVFIYSFVGFTIIFALILILSPAINILETENTQMLKLLKKELKSLLTTDFYTNRR
jgi:hypothetical protein